MMRDHANTTSAIVNTEKTSLLPTQHNDKTTSDHDLARQPTSTRILQITTWTCCLVFGIYIAVFYGKTVVHNAFPAWEISSPGMYHQECSASNWALLAHLVGGAFLMTVGPLQFVKPIRRRYLWIHRWSGRIFIASSYLVALGAMTYISLVGSVGGFQSDIENFIFGSVVLVSAANAHYHAAVTKDIEKHAKWAWRLASLLMSLLLVRFYIAIYILLFAPQGTDTAEFGVGFNVMIYLNYVPNLIFVEIYFKYYRNQTNDDVKTQSTWWITMLKCISILVLVFFTLLLFAVLWLPALTANISTYSLSITPR